MERARGEQDDLFPSLPYLGWLAIDVCICNDQRSSEISCDKSTVDLTWSRAGWGGGGEGGGEVLPWP
jgi:hypothetical protein